METSSILKELGEFCREVGLAESTFGRLAVNDGKLISRLRDGRKITTATLARVRRYIAEHRDSPRPRRGRRAAPHLNGSSAPTPVGSSESATSADIFRAIDSRQRYLHFVQTCGEQPAIAGRIAQELPHLEPHPPAVRILDAALGDGAVFARTLRGLHGRFPHMPIYAQARECDAENLRLALEKLPDRFAEHPPSVVVFTNLPHTEAPWLTPQAPSAAASLLWKEVALTGSSADAFERQVADLDPLVTDIGSCRQDGRHRPLVLVLYRADQRFLLDGVLPKPGRPLADFDLVVAAHPYRSRAAAESKAKRVLAPLVRALARGGRLVGIHATGEDNGMEIVRSLWPDDVPFSEGRHDVLRALKTELGGDTREYGFHVGADARSSFRFGLNLRPDELSGTIPAATLLSAWNAATYVAEIEDRRLLDATQDNRHLAATEAVLRRHGGLWFRDESFLITRRRG